MVITQPSHSNTGLLSPVFRCHLNTGPFANRTTFDHLNTKLVRYSDGYCNWDLNGPKKFASQMVRYTGHGLNNELVQYLNGPK